ncbi:MAG TPA: LytTR family DNA-binding domain-containing protein [Chitinophagaceae bacterium]|nr:LytTR family DNA-binding domain-containing protein [Chitinophagaceae bacterium]
MKQDFFYVRLDKRYEQIAFDAIIYIRGKNGYIQIVTAERIYLVMNTLREVEKHLPKNLFCRIHHSYIVSLRRIKAFNVHQVWLHEPSRKQGLASITELPVGVHYRNLLKGSVIIMVNKSGGKSKARVSIDSVHATR